MTSCGSRGRTHAASALHQRCAARHETIGGVARRGDCSVDLIMRPPFARSFHRYSRSGSDTRTRQRLSAHAKKDGVDAVNRNAEKAGCTPSSLTPVTESSFATFIDVAKLWRAPTPHRSDPRKATYMVALSALRRVRPYRWRPQSPTTAICSLPESLAEAATGQQA